MRVSRSRIQWLLLAALLFPGTAGLAADPIHIQHPTIRWLPGNLPMAGYFTATNPTRRALLIRAFSSPDFASITAHVTRTDGSRVTMQPLATVKLYPGQTLKFSPGGKHLMLMRRRRNLAVGDTVNIVFHIVDGDDLRIPFLLLAPGAMP